MSDSSLPVEILEDIFQDLNSDYTESERSWDLRPRRYLVPLLRVCKLWHLVGERYLYRSIWISFYGPRHSDALVHTLKANSRLATLVEELVLRSNFHPGSVPYTPLIDICPNLRHVDFGAKGRYIRPDSLFEALKKKGLVSFRFNAGVEPISLPIFDLMQSWPQIQTIGISGGNLKLKGHPQASPELRQIILYNTCLCELDFASLRLLCSPVTKLEVDVHYFDTEALDAFCRCLHAWSPTLEYLNITMYGSSSNPPLSDAISSLTSLQELKVTNVLVDFGAISSFPRLKRLHLSARCPDPKVEEDRLAYLLKDLEKFATLTDMQLFLLSFTVQNPRDKRMLQDVCDRRNIALRMS